MGNRMVTRDHKMIPYGLIHTVHTNSVKIKIYGKYSFKENKNCNTKYNLDVPFTGMLRPLQASSKFT